MSHLMSGSNSERTAARMTQNRKPPFERLEVTLDELMRSSPVSLGRLEELTKYSTMLGTSAEPSGERGSHLDAGLRTYTVQQPCKRKLCEDDQANQMVYVESQPPFNLRQSYGTQVVKEDDNEFMELLLRCLANRNLVGKTDFVCHRNLLTNLSVTPYELEGKFDKGLMIVVQKIKGVFYMFEFPTNTATKQLQTLDAKQKEMMYWGLKFESYMRAKPDQAPDPRKPLNFNEEFCSVVTRKVGQHSILLRAEIDCIGSDGGYVELKTNKIFDHDGHEKAFKRHKLIKWWLQCSMAGVENIVCGFRDNDGMVQSLKRYKLDQLPIEMLQRSPNVCMSFLDKFLSFVKSTVHDEGVPHVFQ